MSKLILQTSWLQKFLFTMSLSPTFLYAEGAVRLLNCHVTQECDGEARCLQTDEEVTFRMEPIELAPDGSGRYTISYNEQTAEMQALSEAGPFYWNQDTERHTLLVSSETRLLWHSLNLESTPIARIRFLDCTISQ